MSAPAVTTSAGRFCLRVKDRMAEDSMTLREAVRRTAALNPGLMDDVLDQIGSWPSSEPILAELQRQAS